MASKIATRLMEMIENGDLDKDIVLTACLSFMTAADVREMAELNEFLSDDDLDAAEQDEDDDILPVDSLLDPDDDEAAPSDFDDITDDDEY